VLLPLLLTATATAEMLTAADALYSAATVWVRTAHCLLWLVGIIDGRDGVFLVRDMRCGRSGCDWRVILVMGGSSFTHELSLDIKIGYIRAW